MTISVSGCLRGETGKSLLGACIRQLPDIPVSPAPWLAVAPPADEEQSSTESPRRVGSGEGRGERKVEESWEEVGEQLLHVFWRDSDVETGGGHRCGGVGVGAQEWGCSSRVCSGVRRGVLSGERVLGGAWSSRVSPGSGRSLICKSDG